MILSVEGNWHFYVYYCSWLQWFLSKVGVCKVVQGLLDTLGQIKVAMVSQ
jgi:hypothetical protein